MMSNPVSTQPDSYGGAPVLTCPASPWVLKGFLVNAWTFSRLLSCWAVGAAPIAAEAFKATSACSATAGPSLLAASKGFGEGRGAACSLASRGARIPGGPGSGRGLGPELAARGCSHWSSILLMACSRPREEMHSEPCGIQGHSQSTRLPLTSGQRLPELRWLVFLMMHLACIKRFEGLLWAPSAPSLPWRLGGWWSCHTASAWTPC
jgi:hypothetical protein